MNIERLKSWEGNGSDGVKVRRGSVEVHTGEVEPGFCLREASLTYFEEYCL